MAEQSWVCCPCGAMLHSIQRCFSGACCMLSLLSPVLHHYLHPPVLVSQCFFHLQFLPSPCCCCQLWPPMADFQGWMQVLTILSLCPANFSNIPHLCVLAEHCKVVSLHSPTWISKPWQWNLWLLCGILFGTPFTLVISIKKWKVPVFSLREFICWRSAICHPLFRSFLCFPEACQCNRISAMKEGRKEADCHCQHSW